MLLRCGPHTLDLSVPIVMGVLNVTPDSFSDGGRWLDRDAAVSHGLDMVEQGAEIVDVGGESTRPGAAAVALDEELRRVLPIVEALAKRIAVPISVDTSRPEVIQAACKAGATIINDVRALQLPGALEAASRADAAVCLIHMQGTPASMQTQAQYHDVTLEVRDFLNERIKACMAAGIDLNRIVVDPGIGFGKRPEHNLSLLKSLDSLAELCRPILIGVSRKSLIGHITGRPVSERLAGSIALATAAILNGASIIRAHDVRETVDAVRIASALKQSQEV